MEFLDPGVVLAGPSEDALVYGLSVCLPSGQGYHDDELTDKKLDLICGVYHVYTSELSLLCYIYYY
jgi:hypothetical protein